MTTITTLRTLLLGTALTLPMAGIAAAQTIRIDDAQLADKSEECQMLGRAVQGNAALPVGASAEEIAAALNDDDAAACTTLATAFDGADPTPTTADATTATDETTVGADADAAVTETVDLAEQATIQGQAVVTVPEPNVDVQVPAPSVRVTTSQPDVSVSESATEIDVVQAKPTITVEIPQIIVTVDIPAPQLYVLSGDPKVQVMSADPQVEVQQGPPVISVTQGDPKLAIDLDLKNADAAPVNSDKTADTATGNGAVNNVDGDVQAAAAQPQIEFVKPEGEANVTVQRAEPTVSFEDMAPDVRVMMAEQPTINIQQTGQMSLTVETMEEREARRSQEASATDATAMPATDAAATDATTGTAMPAAGAMSIADLKAMDVVTADGENIGRPEAFIEINGQPNMIISDGGFLGFGQKEVPVPMNRVSIADGRLVVNTLTEDEIASAGDFNYDSSLMMADDMQVNVGGN